jgi:hypothetical protein
MKARAVAVSLVSAALVVGGATAAVAAPAKAPNPKASIPAKAPKPKASITLSASSTHAKPGQSITFTGRTAGLKDGSTVTLQVKDGAKWVSLPATATVKRSAYKLTDEFKPKGVEVLRAMDGTTASNAVTVTVR